MSIMFEGNQPTTLKHYTWEQPPHRPIHVALCVVDDDPGAVQSGHYLWPASPALCKYLVEGFHSSNDDALPNCIVELRAGCALVSLAALQVFESLRSLAMTDYDPGTLEQSTAMWPRKNLRYPLNLPKLVRLRPKQSKTLFQMVVLSKKKIILSKQLRRKPHYP